MLNKLLAVDGYPKDLSLGDAALTALIGFIVVFLGIAFLIFVVWLVGKIMSKGKKPAKSAEKAEKKQPVKEIAPKVNIVVEEEISEETVAVITAAIMAYYQKNNPKCEFTVKRIKRF